MTFDRSMVMTFTRVYLGEILGCLTFILDTGMIMSTRFFIHDVTCLDMYNYTICETLNEHHSQQILLQEKVADLIATHRLINVISLLLTGLFLGALTEVAGHKAGMSIGMFGYFINSICLTVSCVLRPSVTPVKYILIFAGVSVQGLFGERIVVLKNALAYSLTQEKTDHTQRQLVFQGVTFFGSFLACIGVSLPLEVNPQKKSYFAIYLWLSVMSFLGLILPLVVKSSPDSQSDVYETFKDDHPVAQNVDGTKLGNPDSVDDAIELSAINDDNRKLIKSSKRINKNTPTTSRVRNTCSLLRAVWTNVVSIVLILFKGREFNNQTQILVLLFMVGYIGFVMQWYIEEIVLFTFLPPLNWRYFENSIQYVIYALTASIYGVVVLPIIRKVANLSDISVYILGKSAYTLSVTFMIIYPSKAWGIILYSIL
ncbi:unnamed protein product, partial [Owenia fusiformis]